MIRYPPIETVYRFPKDGKHCVWCGSDLPGRRKTFCSPECKVEVLVRAGLADIRGLIERRDHGKCANCGLKTNRLWAIRERSVGGQLGFMVTKIIRARIVEDNDDNFCLIRDELYDRFRAAWQILITKHSIPKRLHINGTFWHADHIQPVYDGGGGCGLENYQTLCWRCHAEKTADEAAYRAKRKKMTPKSKWNTPTQGK